MGTADSISPKFSIIVPAYNAERYIEECLDSALNQTFEDHELIVVDDGSTDATAEICAARLNGAPNARLIRTENQGTLLARREGIAAARGDYLIFLDSDDALNSAALEYCAQVIRDTEADIVLFGAQQGASPEESRRLRPPLLGEHACEDYKRDVLRSCSNNLWAKAIRRTLFDIDTDYAMYSGMKHAEDIFQFLPVVDRANSVYGMDRMLYFYRMSEDQGTASVHASQISDLKHFIDRLKSYGRKWNDEKSAYMGTVENVGYMVEIVSRSSIDYSRRRAYYDDIRKQLGNTVYGCAPAGVRIRKKHKLLFGLLRLRAYRLLDLLMVKYLSRI